MKKEEFGVTVFALPTGIFASGFSKALAAQKEPLTTCPRCRAKTGSIKSLGYRKGKVRMNRIREVISLILLLYFSGVHFIFAQDISISSNIEKAKISIDKNVNFYTEIKWKGEEDEYEIISFETPSCSNLEIANSFSSSKVEGEGDKTFTIKKYTFILKPVKVGKGYVKSVAVKYRRKEEDKIELFLTPKTSVKIISSAGEKLWVLWLGIIGLFLIVLIALIVYLKKKKEKSKEKEGKRKSPEETAVEEIDEANKIRNLSTAIPFYTKISSILKNYLESKYDFKITNMQTNEIVDKLKELDLKEEMLEKVEKILSVSDMVIFAGHKPNYREMGSSYNLIREFIEEKSEEKVVKDKSK